MVYITAAWKSKFRTMSMKSTWFRRALLWPRHLLPDAPSVLIPVHLTRRFGVCCSWCAEPWQKAEAKTCLVDEHKRSCMQGQARLWVLKSFM